jgi:DNA-binding response OmpR family regulator
VEGSAVVKTREKKPHRRCGIHFQAFQRNTPFTVDTLFFYIPGFTLSTESHVRKRSSRMFRPPRTHDILTVEDLLLNVTQCKVVRGGKPLRLNPTNIEVLALLMRRSPAIVTQLEIAAVLWGDGMLKNKNGVATRIHEIRQVVDIGFDIPLIQTLHGVGYRLAAVDDAADAAPMQGQH